MLKILLNENNIEVVFKKYNTMETIKVKENILSVLTLLNLPSEALLKKMKEEGIDLEYFDTVNSRHKKAKVPTNFIQESSSTIIQRQLFRLFLDKKELSAAIKTFDLSEGIAIRRLWLSYFICLNLPSAGLLSKMIEEGVITATVAVPPKEIVEIKEVIHNPKEQYLSVQEKLTKALSAKPACIDIDNFKLAVAKAKLAQADADLSVRFSKSDAKVLAMPFNVNGVNNRLNEWKDEKMTIKNENIKYPRLVNA
jgi:hypothetical protein